MVDKSQKDWVDILMLLMIVLQWFRFYQFFFLISELSKMILTLLAMIIDTQSFFFVVYSYLIVSAVIFTTVFQDVNP